jgi:uroporphyrinogen decarboxylase
MTSRDRMQIALDHREPDRVPFDLGGTFTTGIVRKAWRSLLEAMSEGQREDPPLLDIVQQLVKPDQDILDRFGVDTTTLTRDLPGRPTTDTWEDERYLMFKDPWGISWRMPRDDGLYYDMFEHPLAGCSLEDARAYPWPDATAGFDRKLVRETARRMHEETDKAIIVRGFGSGTLEMTLWLQGFADGYMNMLAEKTLTSYLLDKITDLKIAYAELLLEAAGEYSDVFFISDDVGHQNNPAVSRELFRELLLPRAKRYHDFIKYKCPHLKIFYHTCGAVYTLLPDLIESGIDILNPVQVNAAGMEDTAQLKREFGRELTFWGGIDTQHVMPHGTPQDVKDEVRRRLDDLAPGGGYVLNTVHNIQADVPGENVLALVEALHEYGDY